MALLKLEQIERKSEWIPLLLCYKTPNKAHPFDSVLFNQGFHPLHHFESYEKTKIRQAFPQESSFDYFMFFFSKA